MYVGLYPEGNIASQSKEIIKRYGDEEFFDRLAKMGIEHFTAKDSIAYHLKEGEREDEENDIISSKITDYSKYLVKEYAVLPIQTYEKRVSELVPTIKHNTIINALLQIEESSNTMKVLENTARKLKKKIRSLIIKYFGQKTWVYMISVRNNLLKNKF